MDALTASGAAVSIPPDWMPTSTMSEVYWGSASSQFACITSRARIATIANQDSFANLIILTILYSFELLSNVM